MFLLPSMHAHAGSEITAIIVLDGDSMFVCRFDSVDDLGLGEHDILELRACTCRRETPLGRHARLVEKLKLSRELGKRIQHVVECSRSFYLKIDSPNIVHYIITIRTIDKCQCYVLLQHSFSLDRE